MSWVYVDANTSVVIMPCIIVAAMLIIVVARVLWKHGFVTLHPLASLSSALGRCRSKNLQNLKVRLDAWLYLFDGPNMIQRAFNKAQGKPFQLFAPDTRYVFISSSEHIKELDRAPDTVLSLQAAAKQMLQPKYTMHSFNWFDERGADGVGFVRALRTLLTNDLPNILPNLAVSITSDLTTIIAQHPTIDGSKRYPVYPMIARLTVLSNSFAFFGEDLARNEEFKVSAVNFIEETIKTAEVIRLLPRFLAPLVGYTMAKFSSCQKMIYDTLVAKAELRLKERSLERLGYQVEKHHDCIQWIMETSPRKTPWSAQRIVYELIAIWFGSVHALSTTITYAMHDLCLHPEYVEPLRRELESPQYSEFVRTGSGLPLLDSFIKESARLISVETMGTRRHALQPFTFSDGTKLNAGDWACVPVQAMMRNPEFYPEPEQFHGFRFVDWKTLDDAGLTSLKMPQPEGPSKLTDTEGSRHVWGTGRMTCPGRYYATAVMKVILAEVILNYDCQLLDTKAPRAFTWRSTTIPRSDTMAIFNLRKPEKQ